MNWELIIPLMLFEGNKVELVFNDQKLLMTNEDPFDLFSSFWSRSISISF